MHSAPFASDRQRDVVVAELMRVLDYHIHHTEFTEMAALWIDPTKRPKSAHIGAQILLALKFAKIKIFHLQMHGKNGSKIIGEDQQEEFSMYLLL